MKEQGDANVIEHAIYLDEAGMAQEPAYTNPAAVYATQSKWSLTIIKLLSIRFQLADTAPIYSPYAKCPSLIMASGSVSLPVILLRLIVLFSCRKSTVVGFSMSTIKKEKQLLHLLGGKHV